MNHDGVDSGVDGRLYEFDGKGNVLPCSPRRPAAIKGALRKNRSWQRREDAERMADFKALSFMVRIVGLNNSCPGSSTGWLPTAARSESR
jgi:hypothetical protein